jgi:hypothetical protein
MRRGTAAVQVDATTVTDSGIHADLGFFVASKCGAAEVQLVSAMLPKVNPWEKLRMQTHPQWSDR